MKANHLLFKLCIFFILFYLIDSRKKKKTIEKLEIFPIYLSSCSEFKEGNSSCFFFYFDSTFVFIQKKEYRLLLLEDLNLYKSNVKNKNLSGILYISGSSSEIIENSFRNSAFNKMNFEISPSQTLEMIIITRDPEEKNIKNSQKSFFLEFNPYKSNFLRILINSTSVCGNGIKEDSEECDDGNTDSEDGCSESCIIEAFYDCSQDNGTKCYDSRPPYCFLYQTDEHFFVNLKIYLEFSKVMNFIDFKDTKIVNLSMSEFNSSTDYFWEVSTVDNKTYVFYITFHLSFHSKPLTITFLEPLLIVDINNISITEVSYAPSIIMDEFIYFAPETISFFGNIDIALSYLMIVLLFAFFPLLILDSLSIFWLYVDMLQVLNLLVYLNIDYPDNAVVFFRALSPANFVKVDYLEFFGLDSIAYIRNTLVPYAFQEEKITTNFIQNAFFALLFYVSVIVFYLIVKIFNKVLIVRLIEKNICSWFANICVYTDELMSYSAFLRVILITFVPLNMAFLLQFTNFLFETTANTVNSILAIVCLIHTVCFFIYVCWFLNTSSVDLDDIEIIRKYLPLFDMLKRKEFLKRNFQIFYMLRKFFWLISLIFLDAYPLNQIFVLIFCSFFITTFTFITQPYEVDKINHLTLFTEIMFFIILILLGAMECVNYIEENLLSIELKLFIGWVILAIGLLLILVKALFMLMEILTNIKILVSNTKFLIENINNKEILAGVSAEGDNLLEQRSSSRDNDVEAIKEVDEEDEEEERVKENKKQNMRF